MKKDFNLETLKEKCMKEIDPHLPIDSTAARVVGKSTDTGHKSFHPGHRITSMVPLPTREFPGHPQHNLIGRRAGSFVVVGCALFKPKNHERQENNTRWVVRCKCGRYEMLTTKGVKKEHVDTMCVECTRTRRARYKMNNPQLFKATN